MAAIAVTRFGLGARPGELDRARSDPKAFLIGQINPDGADLPVTPKIVSVGQRLIDQRDTNLARQEAAKFALEDAALAATGAAPPRKPTIAPAHDVGELQQQDIIARGALAAKTDEAFRERWALFWSNHFTVSATNQVAGLAAGPFEIEAIRPHVFGRFEDMLMASSMHPAMLAYLDETQSIGPDSPQAVRQRTNAAPGARLPGLNENLAREIMELHTLGVDAGYSQADVTEFARALTGWTYVGAPAATATTPPNPPAGSFVFRPQTHQPGVRKIFGKTYAQDGQVQAQAALVDFAASPKTARHLATKIARHFVADAPPRALVDKLTQTYVSTGGRLDAVAKALINAPEAWSPQAAKFKTPYEFMISAHRATDSAPTDVSFINTLSGMGQKPFYAPSPKGWDEMTATWASPDALIKRLQWVQTFAAKAGDAAPAQLAGQCLGARLSPAVAKAIDRAETRPEALALLLMSPEFQRR